MIWINQRLSILVNLEMIGLNLKEEIFGVAIMKEKLYLQVVIEHQLNKKPLNFMHMVIMVRLLKNLLMQLFFIQLL